MGCRARFRPFHQYGLRFPHPPARLNPGGAGRAARHAVLPKPALDPGPAQHVHLRVVALVRNRYKTAAWVPQNDAAAQVPATRKCRRPPVRRTGLRAISKTDSLLDPKIGQKRFLDLKIDQKTGFRHHNRPKHGFLDPKIRFLDPTIGQKRFLESKKGKHRVFRPTTGKRRPRRSKCHRSDAHGGANVTGHAARRAGHVHRVAADRVNRGDHVLRGRILRRCCA